ncbi:unnamed protein product [Polarella glacialis]|uniref:Uncharacterized protein n=2 Tax=Polarella glacialis TaxID=89957 RepID=A0A813GBM9_POLGL|nr:unnamed protein product [Polarella glacialis]
MSSGRAPTQASASSTKFFVEVAVTTAKSSQPAGLPSTVGQKGQHRNMQTTTSAPSTPPTAAAVAASYKAKAAAATVKVRSLNGGSSNASNSTKQQQLSQSNNDQKHKRKDDKTKASPGKQPEELLPPGLEASELGPASPSMGPSSPLRGCMYPSEQRQSLLLQTPPLRPKEPPGLESGPPTPLLRTPLQSLCWTVPSTASPIRPPYPSFCCTPSLTPTKPSRWDLPSAGHAGHGGFYDDQFQGPSCSGFAQPDDDYDNVANPLGISLFDYVPTHKDLGPLPMRPVYTDAAHEHCVRAWIHDAHADAAHATAAAAAWSSPSGQRMADAWSQGHCAYGTVTKPKHFGLQSPTRGLACQPRLDELIQPPDSAAVAAAASAAAQRLSEAAAVAWMAAAAAAAAVKTGEWSGGNYDFGAPHRSQGLEGRLAPGAWSERSPPALYANTEASARTPPGIWRNAADSSVAGDVSVNADADAAHNDNFHNELTYTFTIRKADGHEVGLSVSHMCGQPPLVVNAVRPSGAMEAWNKLCVGQRTSKAVHRGDHVISVNCVTDVQGMLEEMRLKQLLRFEVWRPTGEAKRCSMDLIAGSAEAAAAENRFM